jgi:predicted metal-dependent phosphoesterase TrpH
VSIYKYDTHVHTDETSICGKVKAAELVHLYKDCGYCGIVITDHYYKGYFNSLSDDKWEEKILKYLNGYKNALSEGQKIGLIVILGMEIRFNDSPNDYLIYGFDESFLKENKELYNLTLKEFRELTKDKGIMIYQAHPFRNGLSRVGIEFVDGIEVYNGNPRHDSYNDLAYSLAEEKKLKMLSGSDFHQVQDLARGGIVINELITDSEQLAKYLKGEQIFDLYISN